MPKSALINVPDETVTRYVEANEEIERRLGKAPGAEFLMALAVERENPAEIAETFTETIIQNLREEGA
ncbi:MAG: hypothetical protein JWL59_4860 [Chthoniobacteraceae bacterium]|nr:hypothetical protein [Chthoniobacteraceae bacterium]